MTRTRDDAPVSEPTPVPGHAVPTHVPVEEPPRPGRIRRPTDAIRFLATMALLGLVLLLPSIAEQTASGIQSDITHGTEQTPPTLVTLADLVSTFGLLAVPVAFAVDRLIRRDGLRIAVGLLAAVFALGVAFVLDSWVAGGSGALSDYLSWSVLPGPTPPEPVHTDLTPVIAYVTAVRLTGRPRWQAASWTVIALAALAALGAGYVSAFSLAVTYLIGRAIGYATLYIIGAPNPRPPGTAVITALCRMGLFPVSARRTGDGVDESRHYHVALADGSALHVRVLDRDQQIAGLPYRVWRQARLRSGTPRRTLRSLRRSLEQESLMAYAAAAAGVRTPRLITTCEIGPDAALLAYEHVPGRTLDRLADDELTDDLLTAIWRQLRPLQAQRLAHRSLEADAFLVHQDGSPVLIDLRAGEIAATDLALRLDLAQLLTTLALRVGPERAVRTAASVLGADALAGSLPLLQKVALSRATRTTLRHHRDLLTRIREQVLALHPELEVAPVVRLERFRARTIFSIVGAAVAGYFVLSQLSDVDLGRLMAEASWGWAAIGLASSAVTFLAAALMLIGFVPERLPLWRTVLVQLAASFAKLVAPAAVTGVAINTRFLQRSGVRPGPAVASVGASQLAGMVIHILLLVIFGFVSGRTRDATSDLAPSRTVVLVLLAVGVITGVAATIPRIRRIVTRRLRSSFAGVLPRLLDVLQSPKKIATGLGGTLLLTVGFVICLDTSIRAFGGALPWTAVVIVYLTGNAIGSAAPTPGGLGAVEGALSLGLTLSGLPAQTATSAVLLFRLLTFWLPVLPGWAAFTYLQRREAL